MKVEVAVPNKPTVSADEKQNFNFNNNGVINAGRVWREDTEQQRVTALDTSFNMDATDAESLTSLLPMRLSSGGDLNSFAGMTPPRK